MFKKQAKKFEFTDYNVKKLNRPKDVSMLVYADTVTPHLVCVVYRDSKCKIFCHLYGRKMKMIARTDEITVEEARKITYNINDNLDEYLSVKVRERMSLKEDFLLNGWFPRRPKQKELKGTEIILSDENQSLKEKISELNGEIASLKEMIKPLKAENLKLREMLNEVYYARRCYLNAVKKVELFSAEE